MKKPRSGGDNIDVRFGGRGWYSVGGLDLQVTSLNKKPPDLLEDACPLVKGPSTSCKWPVLRHDLLFNPLRKFTGPGIDGDQLAFLDKGGNAEDITRFNGCGFGIGS